MLLLKVANLPKICLFFKFEPVNVCSKTTAQFPNLILLKVIKNKSNMFGHSNDKL